MLNFHFKLNIHFIILILVVLLDVAVTLKNDDTFNDARENELIDEAVKNSIGISRRKSEGIAEKKSTLKNKLLRLSEALKKLQQDDSDSQSAKVSSFHSNLNWNEGPRKAGETLQVGNEQQSENLKRISRSSSCERLRRFLEERHLDQEYLNVYKRNASGSGKCSSKDRGKELEELLTKMNEAEVRANSEIKEVDKYKEIAKEGQTLLADKVKFLKGVSIELRDAQDAAKQAAKAALDAHQQVILHDKKLCKARSEVNSYLKQILDIESNICSVDACHENNQSTSGKKPKREDCCPSGEPANPNVNQENVT